MMRIPCLILPHESADGPGNMALDEALLDAAVGDPRATLLRTYQWSAPTLSLGYFQAVSGAESDPRWRGVPLVRRPTGGGAILHHHEVTYALVVPREHPLARRSAALYQAVHAALAELLRAHGVAAGPRGGFPGSVSRIRPFLCFTDQDPEDIIADGIKIVGSAQRRRSGAVLQHGSLLLKRSDLTPELPGAGDLAPIPADVQTWTSLIHRRIPEALGLLPEPRDIAPQIREHARRREEEVYRDPAWTRKR